MNTLTIEAAREIFDAGERLVISMPVGNLSAWPLIKTGDKTADTRAWASVVMALRSGCDVKPYDQYFKEALASASTVTVPDFTQLLALFRKGVTLEVVTSDDLTQYTTLGNDNDDFEAIDALAHAVRSGSTIRALINDQWQNVVLEYRQTGQISGLQGVGHQPLSA